MDLREMTGKERGRLWIRLGIRLLLAAAVILLLVYAVPPLLSLFMPFVVAVVVAWILNPLVRWLHKKLKIPRKPIALIVILLAIAIVGGALVWFIYGLGSEVYSLVSNWSAVSSEFESTIDAVGRYFAQILALMPEGLAQTIENSAASLLNWLREVVPNMLASIGKGAGNFAMKVPGVVIGAVIFLIASYFIIGDYPRLRLMATERMSADTRSFLSRVRKIALAAFSGYIRAQLLLSLIVFFILLISFSIVGQSYAILLAFVFAVLDFIPILGVGAAMVPWAIVDLMLGNYRMAIFLLVMWGVIVIFRRIAEPKVVGDQTGLSPILSLISIYVGMRLGGVLGMIFGPVLLLIIINVYKMDVLSGTRRDVRMAVQDVRTLLEPKKKEE